MDRAFEAEGGRVVAMCEKDEFCRKILRKHWPDVPIFEDVKTLRGEDVGTVDVIYGGPPCQPISIAGKKAGKCDERYLWPEMHRIISSINPTWVVFENVENVIRMVADDIINDLEAIGYSVWASVVSAYCAGAWFDGKRAFIVAATDNRSAAMRRYAQLQANEKAARSGDHHGRRAPSFDTGERWKLESRPYGVVDGIPNRVHRLRALGNAVVPQQMEPVFRAIMEVEHGLKSCRK